MQAIGRLGKRMISARGSLGRWKEASHNPPRALFSLSLSVEASAGREGGRERDRQSLVGACILDKNYSSWRVVGTVAP